jgi:hypothetical protein
MWPSALEPASSTHSIDMDADREEQSAAAQPQTLRFPDWMPQQVMPLRTCTMQPEMTCGNTLKSA